MQRSALYFRNFIFGVEDSLVSTVGLLSGIAIGGVPRGTIFLTGIVLIVVEATSMAAGSFLSESSAQEYTGKKEDGRPVLGGSIMFVSYFAAGFIPLAPYLVIEPPVALYVSVSASLAALFILGVVSGTLSRTSPARRGARMLIVGGIATAIGVAAGMLFAV